MTRVTWATPFVVFSLGALLLGGDCVGHRARVTIKLRERGPYDSPLFPNVLTRLVNCGRGEARVYLEDASRRHLFAADLARLWRDSFPLPFPGHPGQSHLLYADPTRVITARWPRRAERSVCKITWWNADMTERVLETVVETPHHCDFAWLGEDILLAFGRGAGPRNKATGPIQLYRCQGGLAKPFSVIQPMDGEYEIDGLCNLGDGRVILIVSDIGEESAGDEATALLVDGTSGQTLATRDIGAVNDYRFYLPCSGNAKFFITWPAVESSGNALWAEVRRTDTLDLVFRAQVGEAPIHDVVSAAVSDDGRFLAAGYDKVVVFDNEQQTTHVLWDVIGEVEWTNQDVELSDRDLVWDVVVEKWDRTPWEVRICRTFAFRPIAMMFVRKETGMGPDQLVVITGDSVFRTWTTDGWKPRVRMPWYHQSTLLKHIGARHAEEPRFYKTGSE